ncbi:DUF4179 domain-containing protein [Haloimpatiens sp. FM7330]|uniref:DUF4179 domain-containing protein n=1 Tax=Haloimpatiens sp. FM7330 TaxID=3298610 RepID=UPI003644DDA2
MKIEEKILDVIDYVDVKEEDFNYVDVEINEIEKKRIKKNIRKKILHKKKAKGKIIAAAGILGFAIFSGIILYKPAFAKDFPIFDVIYEKLGYYKEYNDYTEYIGKSKKSNGYTFTIEKLVGTPNKIVLAVKIHSDKPFKKQPDVGYKNNFFPSVQYEGTTWDSGGSGCNLIDKNNLLAVYEVESMSGFPKRGKMKINIQSFEDNNDNTSVKFNFKVDFSSSYEKTISKKINKVIGNGTKIEKINSSILGTFIFMDNSNNDKEQPVLLKLDENIYSFNSYGSKYKKACFFFPKVTYKEMKEAKRISIIPINRDFNEGDDKWNKSMEKINKLLEKKKVSIQNKVRYYKTLTFTDDTKGEFYKIERKNNKVKLYFKSDKHTLEFLSKLVLSDYAEDKDSESFISNLYWGYVYKDINTKNGYVVEFDDINDNKELELVFFRSGLIVDGQSIGKEIYIK